MTTTTLRFYVPYLPPVNEVCEGNVFTGVCLSTGGGGHAWQGWHTWPGNGGCGRGCAWEDVWQGRGVCVEEGAYIVGGA